MSPASEPGENGGMTWLGACAAADMTARTGGFMPSRHRAPVPSRCQKFPASRPRPRPDTRYCALGAVDYPNPVWTTPPPYCAIPTKHGSCLRRATTTRCGFRLARGCRLRFCTAFPSGRLMGVEALKAKPPLGWKPNGGAFISPAITPLSGRGGGEAQERFDHVAPDAVKAARAYGRINRASPPRLRPARGSNEPRHCTP